MALSVTGKQVEDVLRALLPRQGYKLQNRPRKSGETGADIIVEKNGQAVAIECIGFQEVAPRRSKQFYEVFFRTISRLKDGADVCVMALPERFGRGLNQRAGQYGLAWKRIGEAFPELKIWLVDTKLCEYKAHDWNAWPAQAEKKGRRTWNPRPGTIGAFVAEELAKNFDINYDVLRERVLERFPSSKFSKQHLAWYKSQFRKWRQPA